MLIAALFNKATYKTVNLFQIFFNRYTIGIIPTKWNLQVCDKVSASSFCRRRLPCIMVKNGMTPNLKTAITFIEQGHIRVGADVVKDPAFLITRLD